MSLYNISLDISKRKGRTHTRVVHTQPKHHTHVKIGTQHIYYALIIYTVGAATKHEKKSERKKSKMVPAWIRTRVFQGMRADCTFQPYMYFFFFSPRQSFLLEILQSYSVLCSVNCSDLGPAVPRYVACVLVT